MNNLLARSALFASIVASPLQAQSPDSGRADSTGVVRVSGWAPGVQSQPLRLLIGRVPSAVVSGMGRPGDGGDAVLRGDIAGLAAPLIIVDGIATPAGALDIAPDDIAAIEVVPGAAAAAVYGARAGAGVIRITTRRAAPGAARSSVGLRAEAGSAGIERELDRTGSTIMLLDAANQRFCANVAGAPLCGVTVDWSAEAARVNDVPGAPIAPVAFPLTSASMSSRALANAYSARAWPGRTFDPLAQLTRRPAFLFTGVDAALTTDRYAVHGSLSRLAEPGAMPMLDGYRRLGGRAGFAARVAPAWSVSLLAAVSHSSDDGRLIQDPDGALLDIYLQPPAADLLARDALGRPFLRTDLRPFGSGRSNPLAELEEIRDEATTDRVGAQVAVTWMPAGRATFDARAGVDRLDFTRRVTQVAARTGTPAGEFLLQPASADVVNADAGVRYRLEPAAGLRVTPQLRFSYDHRDRESRWFAGIASTTVVTTSSRDVAVTAGATADYRLRYVLDVTLRRDDLTGGLAPDDVMTTGRVAAAWRAGAEPWWPGGGIVSDATLRVARGTAGGRTEVRLHEIGTPPAPNTLMPEVAGTVTATEIGARVELFRRARVEVTRTATEQKEAWFLVPLATQLGFVDTWTPAATIEGNSWTIAAAIPVVERPGLAWSVRLGYDRTRAKFGALSVPPFMYGTGGAVDLHLAAPGEPLGAIYGRAFARSCGDLPAAFALQCGDGRAFQRNDDGYLVWVGTDAGGTAYSWRDGITRNLWGTQLGAAQGPWGVALNWGAPIIVRSAACETTPNPNCAGRQVRLGTGLPDWQVSVGSSFRWGRLSIEALLQGSAGREVWNEARQWAYLDFISGETDQAGRTPETAKPAGYYWRAPPADGFSGYGGLYDFLAPNSHFVESTSYAKLRELAVTWDIGPLLGRGAWSVTLLGRNLFTITDYTGLDPEVPLLAGAGRSELSATDLLAFPNQRSVSVSVSARF